MSETNGTSPLATPPAPAAVPSPKVEGPLATGRPLRPIALALITVILIALCVYLVWPYMSAVVWALALAIIAWPLHVWMSRQTRVNWLAAGISTITVLLFVLVPLLFVSYQLAREASSAAERMRLGKPRGCSRTRSRRRPCAGSTIGPTG